jgi:LysM repeat protein
MSNDVKRIDQGSGCSIDAETHPPAAPARLTVLACLIALAVLLTQLPGPMQALAELTGTAAARATGVPLAAVQSMLLITAGLLTWLLAAWAVVVLGVGLIARLPGRSGRRARRLLPRIAPASVGRLVLAAVGVSLIAGTAACAAPGSAGTPAGGSTVTATTAPSAPSPSGSLTIDWPDPRSGPSPTASGSPAPVTDPPSVAASSTDPTPASTPASTPTSTLTSTSTSTFAPAPAPAAPSTPASAATPAPAGAATPVPAATEPAAPASPPASASAPTAADPTAAPAPAGAEVTVQPGDCLWRIAAHGLGAGATDSDVDNAWRAWYFVNHEVIGDDPDVIVPGQRLVAPAATEPVRP